MLILGVPIVLCTMQPMFLWVVQSRCGRKSVQPLDEPAAVSRLDLLHVTG